MSDTDARIGAEQARLPLWLPPTQAVEILADPDQRDAAGRIWTLLDDAVVPDAVRPGRLVVAGAGEARFPAIVEGITSDPRGTIVLLRQLTAPASVAAEGIAHVHPADLALLQLRQELRATVRALAGALVRQDLHSALQWPQWRELQRLAELPDTALGLPTRR